MKRTLLYSLAFTNENIGHLAFSILPFLGLLLLILKNIGLYLARANGKITSPESHLLPLPTNVHSRLRLRESVC
jgi:hypothetical protein